MSMQVRRVSEHAAVLLSVRMSGRRHGQLCLPAVDRVRRGVFHPTTEVEGRCFGKQRRVLSEEGGTWGRMAASQSWLR